MKQALSILLLAILSFNWFGYRLVSGFLENKATASLQKQIDRSAYQDDQLLEIRVPLNTPYMAGASHQFEPIEGEIELGGKTYRYVKRKVDNGELVLLCLPDENSSRFQQSRMDFFKLVNDLGQSSRGNNEKHGNVIKAFVAEYSPEKNSWTLTAPCVLQQNFSRIPDTQLSYLFYDVLKRPPRA
ncbi:MAG TPA: hypothetical protein VK628_09425 [Flavitalea sp.]|nr:hypothetical protein [Flavitalea sp.]